MHTKRLVHLVQVPSIHAKVVISISNLLETLLIFQLNFNAITQEFHYKGA